MKQIKGLSEPRLYLCKDFYLAYPQIFLTASRKSGEDSFFGQITPNLSQPILSTGLPKIQLNDADLLLSRLSFSHFIELLKAETPLKRTFDHADAGQMNMYLNYYRENEMIEGDNPPVGIILCAQKNDTLVHYATGSLSQQIFVSKYLVNLPKEEELKTFIEREHANVDRARKKQT